MQHGSPGGFWKKLRDMIITGAGNTLEVGGCSAKVQENMYRGNKDSRAYNDQDGLESGDLDGHSSEGMNRNCDGRLTLSYESYHISLG